MSLSSSSSRAGVSHQLKFRGRGILSHPAALSPPLHRCAMRRWSGEPVATPPARTRDLHPGSGIKNPPQSGAVVRAGRHGSQSEGTGCLSPGRGTWVPHGGRRRAAKERERAEPMPRIRAATHLGFFCRFDFSFLGISFSFFGAAVCSLKEALSSRFLLPSQAALPRSCSPSSSLCLLRPVCFLRGDPGLGLPPARSFWLR